MGRRRTTTTETAPTTETTTTTTSGGMDGGGGGMDGGGGGGGGMGGGACYVYPNSPATPGIVTPDVTYTLTVDMNIPLTMDDGNTVNMWGFSGTGGGMMGGGGTFPSPAMRMTEGTIVHTNLNIGMMNGVHTVHHHGIEPSTESDGVGHITWDVNGSYTYQWRPAHAGTYFYHCHTNTVLHAEMGMYGALIVDPPEGPGTLFSGGPKYDVEAFWVVDEIDSSWHTLPWTAGTCGGDVGLNELNPDYFVITGVDGTGNSAMNTPPISATVQRGQKLLARYICAGYHPQKIRFGGLSGKIYASDGRPLPKPVSVTSIRAASAERYDIIFEPTERGTYLIETDIIHWVTGKVLGTTRTSITVT
ncbi:MAG: multicopper oxidase domain-containing protein [Gammaproteobacteria bacterium]|nr:multicopper oxidase domain-containing protein [Gammaproteobacteria bacterium]